MTTPSYAKYLLAVAAALSAAAIYFGPMYPTYGYFLIGVVGIINAFSAFLGWGTAPAVAAAT